MKITRTLKLYTYKFGQVNSDNTVSVFSEFTVAEPMRKKAISSYCEKNNVIQLSCVVEEKFMSIPVNEFYRACVAYADATGENEVEE